MDPFRRLVRRARRELGLSAIAVDTALDKYWGWCHYVEKSRVTLLPPEDFVALVEILELSSLELLDVLGCITWNDADRRHLLSLGWQNQRKPGRSNLRAA